MAVVGPKRDPVEGIDLAPRLLAQNAEDLAQDAKPVVVGARRMLDAHHVEIRLGDVRTDLPDLGDLGEHPLGLLVADDPLDEHPPVGLLRLDGVRREIPTVGRLHVLVPGVDEEHLLLLVLETLRPLPFALDRRLDVLVGALGVVLHIRTHEVLEEPLGRFPVAGTGRLADPLAVDRAPEGIDAVRLLLQTAFSFVTCHIDSLLPFTLFYTPAPSFTLRALKKALLGPIALRNASHCTVIGSKSQPVSRFPPLFIGPF